MEYILVTACAIALLYTFYLRYKETITKDWSDHEL